MKNHVRILSLILAVVLLLGLGLSCAAADGEYGYGNNTGNWSGSAIWDPTMQCYVYDQPHYGIVLCTRMTVRATPSTSGSSLGRITNGQPVKIIGVTQKEDWFVIDLQSCNFAGAQPGTYGYGKASLIKMDAQWVYSDKTVNLYATPWARDKKNGEQGNRFFLLIDQYSGWYAVQTQETTPGTSFIRSEDIAFKSMYYQNQYVIVWDAPLYDVDTWATIQTVKRFTLCTVIDEIENHYKVIINQGTANETQGWIDKQNAGQIIN